MSKNIPKKIIDITGVELMPGEPDVCIKVLDLVSSLKFHRLVERSPSAPSAVKDGNLPSRILLCEK